MTQHATRTITAASLLSIAAALAMPLAIAQTDPSKSGAADAADAPSSGQTTAPQATAPQATAPESTAAQPGDEPRQLTWADVDVDGSGAISKEESGQLPSLAQVFPDADADADGQLTPDEYKAYVATVGGAGPGAGGSD